MTNAKPRHRAGFFICGTPHTEPTAWDPSARADIAFLIFRPVAGFLFQAPGTIIDMPSC
jgi:hypothetical protein